MGGPDYMGDLDGEYKGALFKRGPYEGGLIASGTLCIIRGILLLGGVE